MEHLAFECVELARRITEEEDRAGHQRTLLVGDMNMNPFEPGMVSSVGLNAVMSRQIAQRATRTVQGREYRLFYNPMWGHFGDMEGDTAGSYFYDSAEHLNYFWNVFDQVLLRPELAKQFKSGQLRTVKTIGTRSLVARTAFPILHFILTTFRSSLNLTSERFQWRDTPTSGGS